VFTVSPTVVVLPGAIVTEVKPAIAVVADAPSVRVELPRTTDEFANCELAIEPFRFAVGIEVRPDAEPVKLVAFTAPPT
jgi:hypothetical protein